jgi:ribosomal protein S3
MQKVSKIQISGRLNGAEMARSESYKDGRIHSLLEQILITL